MSKSARDRIRGDFADRCAYCRSPLNLLAGSGQIDHIVPSSQGGSDQDENLCLCCAWCNLRKGDRIFARDPITMHRIRLFHPRTQRWERHFAWTDSNTRILGLTACGRATIDALDLNNVECIRCRQFWIIAGWHPPNE
jgi:hypothetical protein